jgi:hypothetical protein
MISWLQVSTVGFGTTSQVVKLRVRFMIRSLNFSFFRTHYGPEVDSAPKRNEKHASSWWVKRGQRKRLTTSLPSMIRFRRKCGGIEVSQSYGFSRTATRIALPYTLRITVSRFLGIAHTRLTMSPLKRLNKIFQLRKFWDVYDLLFTLLSSGSNTVKVSAWISQIRRRLHIFGVEDIYTLNMEATCTSETLVPTYNTTRCLRQERHIKEMCNSHVF